MRVEFRYGDGSITLEIPKQNLAGVVTPKRTKLKADIAKELNHVLGSPHGPTLSELVKSKSACVLIADHTRDEPHNALVEAVVPSLVDANRIQFIVTTGSHEVEHPGNLQIVDMIRHASEDYDLPNYKILIHDCQSPDVINLGKTSRGTPVIVNSAAIGHDVYVPLSDMKAHYFAGYSNALKDFLPGVCAFSTIEANHSMSMDPNSTFGTHPFHPDPSRRINPLADDMREAAEIITRDAKVFTLSVISSGNRLVWADAGRMKPVIARGIEVLEETASFTLTPTPRIIVSPGGYPQDKSLYHAQRALELTKNAVNDGGEILLLAECRDGVGPPETIENFYQKMTVPLDDIITSIKGRYHLYEHKAYKFAELLRRISSVRMYTDLDRNTVEAAHLDKTTDPQNVVDDWVEQDSQVKILALDEGNKISVYAS